MKLKRTSYFREGQKNLDEFKDWVKHLEQLNERTYERYQFETSLGKTWVWGHRTQEATSDTLVIFPGARTTALVWDFDRGLDNLNHDVRIFMIEPNGLPNLSDGSTPDIKSLDYGVWANEVLNRLNIEETFIAGASFGGLLSMKLSIVQPKKVKAAFLLNPACLQSFSLTFKNLYYNLLPVLLPSRKNVLKFLNAEVFAKPNHQLSPDSEKLLLEYQLLALNHYKDRTQKPYYMHEELNRVSADTYLILGDKDLLFPYQRSITNAEKHLQNLRDVRVFHNVGHGIETYPESLRYIGKQIKNHES